MLEEICLREVEVNATDLVDAFENHDPNLLFTLDQADGTISDEYLDEDADIPEWDVQFIGIPPFEWDFAFLARLRFIYSLYEAIAKRLPLEPPMPASEDNLRLFIHVFDESISGFADDAELSETYRAWRAFQEDVCIRYAKHWLADDYKVEAIIPPIHSVGGVYPYSHGRRQLKQLSIMPPRHAQLDLPGLSESDLDFSIQEIYVARHPFDSIWPFYEPNGELSLNRRSEKEERRNTFYFKFSNEPGRAYFIRRYCRKMWAVRVPYAVLGDVPRSATLYCGNTEEESYPVYDEWQELIEYIWAAVDQALERGRIDESSHEKICDRLEAEDCNHALSC